MKTSDIVTFLDAQSARIAELERANAALTDELETLQADFERRLPEYRGFEFWLTELDAGTTKDTPNYGYQLRSVNGQRVACGGGAYATKNEATSAALARIKFETSVYAACAASLTSANYDFHYPPQTMGNHES